MSPLGITFESLLKLSRLNTIFFLLLYVPNKSKGIQFRSVVGTVVGIRGFFFNDEMFMSLTQVHGLIISYTCTGKQ